MLLNSFSTSAAGTLFSSFPESPNRDFHTTYCTKQHPLWHGRGFFFFHSLHSLSLTPFLCSNSTPVPEINQETGGFRPRGIRRAWSDGNLEKVAHTSCDKQDFCNSSKLKNKFPYRHHNTMLRNAPSLSVFNTFDDGEKNEGDLGREEEGLARTVTIGEGIGVEKREDFSFSYEGIELIEEGEEDLEEGDGTKIQKSEDRKQPASPPMYLAAGLGINGIDFGGGGDSGVHLTLPNFDEGGNAEDYYTRMINEYPCHPLFLANYAQLLQSKGDLHGAEEYYYRATLADPGDGEVLMKYAKLVWELHHDQDRASSNFERAVQAAPQDSHVLAAYASFLWEVEDDVEEDAPQHEHEQVQVGEEESLKKFENSSTMDDSKGDYSASYPPKGEDLEEYFRRMVEENPCNSLVLRNYAQFLHQTKGDLQGAEEYYSRSILADPGDGEVLSEYAKLVWECHHDHDRASSYFERSVQATPDNSYVLAAYASFLWETEESEKMV